MLAITMQAARVPIRFYGPGLLGLAGRSCGKVAATRASTEPQVCLFVSNLLSMWMSEWVSLSRLTVWGE